MAPKEDENLLSHDGTHQNANYVYDFLYQDVSRIGSYLAQLAPLGHVNAIKHTSTNQENRTSSTTIFCNFLLKILNFGGNKTSRKSKSKSDADESSIDPLWRNAIQLKSILSEQGMIASCPTQAEIGRFVLLQGSLSIFNLKLLDVVWNSEKLLELSRLSVGTLLQVDKHFRKYASVASKLNKIENKNTADDDVSKAFIDMIKSLPLPLQGRLTTKENNLFCFSLQESGLTSGSLDLLSKYGTAIHGKWFVLGILDAKPNSPPVDQNETTNHFFNIINAISWVARIFGRSGDSYGISPLLIYRKAH